MSRLPADLPLLLWLCAFATASACADAPPRLRVGDNCAGDDECETGLCVAALCVDPEADDDGDGLVNRVEVDLGTDPQSADTDEDRARDDAEVGDLAAPFDQDGDGRIDAVEADNRDADTDCLADEFDPRDAVPDAAPASRIAELCPDAGVCAGAPARRVVCPEALDTPVCDLSAVPHHEDEETACDGRDNDCNGATDEGCPAAPDGLVGHWKLDGDGLDSGPFGDHGVVAGATAVTDRFGVASGALRFTDTNAHVAVPFTRHPLGPSVTVTLTAWVRPDAAPAAHMGVLAFGGASASGRSGMTLGRETAWRPCLLAGGARTTACAPPGHWSLLALVRDGKTERRYLDGRLVQEVEVERPADLRLSALTIGATTSKVEGTFEPFRGHLDDVRLYARALGAAEITKLFLDGGWQPAGTPRNPGQSCLHVRDAAGADADGATHLDTDGDGPERPLVAWCDQRTDGGGWTLVWGYGFTRTEGFTTAENAVTPSPGWPLGGVDVPTSDVAPAAPGERGAILWDRWEALGTEFLHAQALTGSLACTPLVEAGGSLATGVEGGVDCRRLDAGGGCEGLLPTWVFFWDHGPGLSGENLFVYLDGSVSGSWPTHDPCGRGQAPTRPAYLEAPGMVYLR